MLNNRMLLNDTKTEFLVIASHRQEKKLRIPGIKIGDCMIPPSKQARNLGVIFDKNLNMQAQITNICRSAYFQLRNVLTKDTTEKLIHA